MAWRPEARAAGSDRRAPATLRAAPRLAPGEARPPAVAAATHGVHMERTHEPGADDRNPEHGVQPSEPAADRLDARSSERPTQNRPRPQPRTQGARSVPDAISIPSTSARPIPATFHVSTHPAVAHQLPPPAATAHGPPH